jgi:hypothetical protein
MSAMSANPAAASDRVAKHTRSQRGLLSVVAAALTILGASACSTGPLQPSGLPEHSGTPHVCKLLLPSQVSAVIGQPVTQATGERIDEFPAPTGADCTYNTSQGLSIWVEVLPHLDARYRKLAYGAAETSILGGQTELAPVVRPTGVGDKAIASGLGIAVLTGNVVVEITGVPQDSSGHHAQVIHLAQTLISGLGL